MGEPTGRKALLRSLAGSPIAELGKSPGIEAEVVESLKGSGFRLQARRWVVERTFAWLVKLRRLRADYEERARTVVAWIHAAIMRLINKIL